MLYVLYVLYVLYDAAKGRGPPFELANIIEYSLYLFLGETVDFVGSFHRFIIAFFQ